MRTILFENESLRVGVTPDYGARVVSLFDRLSGREWMTQGSASSNTGEEAVYLGEEAVAWDECFPTVGPWDASGTAWGRRLRDHGDLWGRRWQVDTASAEGLTVSFTTAQFKFVRELRLEGTSLVARYAVTNLGDAPLPYLWALHALLAVMPEDRIELPGVDTVEASYLSVAGQMLPSGRLKWPGGSGAVPFRLDRVQLPSSLFAGKLLASDLPDGSASIGHDGQWLDISWSGSIASLGIWLTYGGWPAADGHYEAALEPTSSPTDHLGQAIAAGCVPLAPGEQRRWDVTLTRRS